MEPFSITAGVLTTIKVAGEVTFILRQFCEDASLVHTTLSGLLDDVTGFQHVLESMHDTFGRDDVSSTFGATGHVGNHWKNVTKALQSGTETLQRLRILLDNINTTKSFLDGPRKQLRLKTAVDQIANLRDQIQSYQGALQLSLSSIIFATIQQSTDLIAGVMIPNQDKLYDEFRAFVPRLLSLIAQREKRTGHEVHEDMQLAGLHSLRDCVRSAADIVSTASSAVQSEAKGPISVKYGSDFGDLFVKNPNEAMQRWMTTNTVHEFEDANSPMPAPSDAGTAQAPTECSSDSDSDLEKDMVRALFNKGKRCQETGDLYGAERQFRSCLSRLHVIPAPGNRVSPRGQTVAGVSKAEILALLIEIYVTQEDWAKAKNFMMDRMGVVKLEAGSKSQALLWDTIKLTELLMRNKDFAEAQLHGRRALHGFKKLRKDGNAGYERCLVLLIHICTEARDLEDKEAFAAMLEAHRAQMGDLALAGSHRGSTVASTSVAADNKNTRSLGADLSHKAYDETPGSPTLAFLARSSSEVVTRPHDRPSLELATSVSSDFNSPRNTPDLGERFAQNHTARSSPITHEVRHSAADLVAAELMLASKVLPSRPALRVVEDAISGSSKPLTTCSQGSVTHGKHPLSQETQRVSDVDTLSPFLRSHRQQALSVDTLSSLNTELSISDCAGSSVLLSPTSQFSETITPTSTVQQSESTSHVELFTSFCKYELLQTPVFVLGRDHTGYHASAHVIIKGVRQNVTTTVGFKSEEQAKDAAAVLAYEAFCLRTAEGVAAIKAHETMDDHQVSHGPSEKLDNASTKHATDTRRNARAVRNSDAESLMSASGDNNNALASVSYSPPRSSSPSGLEVKTSNIEEAVDGSQPSREAKCANLSRLSNVRRKRLSMTNLDDSKPKWSSAALNVPEPPFHRRPASTSELQSNIDEWLCGDDLNLTIQTTDASSTVGARVPTPIGCRPEVSSTGKTARDQDSSLSEPVPKSRDDEADLPCSSCPVCGLVFTGLPAQAAVQHLHRCLHRQAHTTSVGEEQQDDPNDRATTDPLKGLRLATQSCFVCESKFEEMSQDGMTIHVNRCLDLQEKNDFSDKTPVEIDPPNGVPTNAVGLSSSDRTLQAPAVDVNAASQISLETSDSTFDVNKMFSKLLSHSAPIAARRNILVLGDPYCGKTSLVRSWPTYNPLNVQDRGIAQVHINRVLVQDVPLDICIYDPQSFFLEQEWKKSAFEYIHCVLLCFDIGDVDSLDNVESEWNRKATNSLKRPTRILVGCKYDTKLDPLLSKAGSMRNLAISDEAAKLARKHGMLRYFSTSTKTNQGLDELFEFTAQTVFGVSARRSARKSKRIPRSFFFGSASKD